MNSVKKGDPAIQVSNSRINDDIIHICTQTLPSSRATTSTFQFQPIQLGEVVRITHLVFPRSVVFRLLTVSNKWFNNAYNCTPSISTLTLELRQTGSGVQKVSRSRGIFRISVQRGGGPFPAWSRFPGRARDPPYTPMCRSFIVSRFFFKAF